MTTEIRPTPETDAQCYDCEYRGDMGCKFTADAGKLRPDGDHVPADFARKLERERDEAREANAVIQAREADLVLSKDRISKRAEAIRCELVESEKLLASEKSTRNAIIKEGVGLEKQLEAMREAIKEAAHTMGNLIIAKRGGMQPANALIDATLHAKATLAKLQPFLNP